MEELLKFEFQEHFDRLVKWFRINMTAEQAGTTFSRVKNLPLEGLKFSVDYFIDNSRPTPGNFPTINELINKIYEWLEANPAEKFKRTSFKEVEDFTYPLQKLWEGYNILSTRGEKAFEKFANQYRMPVNDRERVRMKNNVVRQGKSETFNDNLLSKFNRVSQPVDQGTNSGQ